MTLIELATKAKAAKYKVALLPTDVKNKAILAVADALVSNSSSIIAANSIDMENGTKKGLSQGLLDRLKLDEDRINGMAEGLRQVVALDDPIGKITEQWERPNGLIISKRLVPIGVVGVIYEARPNVTADVFGLCFKTGNSVILKGGSDALESNKAIVKVIKDTLTKENVPVDAITLIEDTTRESTNQLMRMNDYVDVLIPRGGAGLIKSVVENASVPVIETGSGNCHIYVDHVADIDMAINIIVNAKTQRIGVCNACESLVIHEDIASELLPKLTKALKEHGVKIFADEKAKSLMEGAEPATEQDFATEYLDYIISVKTVSSVEEAIEHINKYNTGHSESIITKDDVNAAKFLDGIDAACVYVNASTRFTDGFEFGFGAEIGISTQKLHARGPMGLLALTSYKYTIHGNGQVRK
ncbi:glutamate-5-semialdehyde dehydrogenase [Pseudobutyrivibrio ruminis]|uniref:glutamate-5-semialdehyde dehydrogenase n=1 Tax=Pseudobutyrivibrio ruminis TaxID=46206 RepID=UPI000424DA3E|nr:glutamate-5-semialdehyde dehydrogenase [Pseudobutyrivibrio ruminis]